jgi:hypothetical protein
MENKPARLWTRAELLDILGEATSDMVHSADHSDSGETATRPPEVYESLKFDCFGLVKLLDELERAVVAAGGVADYIGAVALPIQQVRRASQCHFLSAGSEVFELFLACPKHLDVLTRS